MPRTEVANHKKGSNTIRAFAAIAATITAGLASPAMAASEPTTRLVSCRSESCLQISGRRSHSASVVTINGNAVAVEGKRNWRVSLPVDTVREWSEPYARTITVSVDNTAAEADLPIGLLGHVENLAMLVISVK